MYNAFSSISIITIIYLCSLIVGDRKIYRASVMSSQNHETNSYGTT